MAFEVGTKRGRWVVAVRDEQRVLKVYPNHEDYVNEVWLTWECDGYGDGGTTKHRQKLRASNSYNLWGCRDCARLKAERKANGELMKPGRRPVGGPKVAKLVGVPVDLIWAFEEAAAKSGLTIGAWLVEAGKEKLFG